MAWRPEDLTSYPGPPRSEVVNKRSWRTWLRWTLAGWLIGEWLVTALLLWLSLALQCVVGPGRDTFADRPLAVAVVIWLPIAALVLLRQARLPSWCAPVAIGGVVLLHLALLGLALDVLPYPTPPPPCPTID